VPAFRSRIPLLKTTTNPEGRYYFSSLEKGKVKLSIVDPENGKAMTAKAVYEGKEYALDQIPIKARGVKRSIRYP
jgi:hypothetical protein